MGSPRASNSTIREYLTARRIIKPDGCWEWQLRPESKGYGQVWHTDYYSEMAHRVSYELHVKPIAQGMTLDHTCWNKICINPEHLEEVTSLENTKRWAARDLCRKGHPLKPGNLYVWAGVRRCKICYNEYLCGKKI